VRKGGERRKRGEETGQEELPGEDFFAKKFSPGPPFKKL
jgi:hypothetical protein